MKKIFILLGIASLALGLVACDGTTGDTSKTPPIFSSIVVENEDPYDGIEYTTYFMEKEDEVEVEVNLLNPYQYTVTSIVINGYNYRFSKFESGSDFNTIIINVPVGSSLGDMVYTVEEIVYQDGDASITIPVDTENIFEVYVYKEHPKVALEGYNLEKNSLELDLLVTDSDTVIAPFSLKAVLYSNDIEIDTILLSVGTQAIIFENLDADNIYEVKVFADYNLEDGNGFINDYLLYSGLYSTNANLSPTADIANIVVTANSVTFDVDYNDFDDVTITDGITIGLYDGETELETQSITESEEGLTFDVLLNDAAYQLKVISSYDLDDGEGIVEEEVLTTVDFVTLPRVIPIPDISDLIINEDEVSFGIFIDDPNGVIDTATLVANIIVDGVVVQSADISDYSVYFEVFNLLSDFNFDVEIRASFNLNDGLGVQENQVIYYQSYTTTTTQLPELSINTVDVTQGYISIDLDVYDMDEVVIDGMLVAKLYEDGSLVDTVEFSLTDTLIVFEYLAYFDYSYEVVIYTDYNLRDGVGDVTDYILINKILTSLSVKAPSAEIDEYVVAQEEIILDITVMDSDSTLTDLSSFARLYLDGVLISQVQLFEGSNPNITFSGLQSNTMYTVQVVGDYDLDNGDGEQEDEQFDSQVIVTNAKTAPSATVTDSTVSSTTLDFDITVTDADSTVVLVSLVAVLRNDLGTIVGTEDLVVGSNSISFTGLRSETNHTLEVITDYNLNTGDSNLSIVMDDITKITYDKELPSGFIITVSVDEDTYIADITVIDDFAVILPGTLTAVLYLDDSPTAFTAPIIVGFNENVTFTGLDSNNHYEIRVTVDYNLNAGDADEHGYPLDDKLFYTIEKPAPTIDLEPPVTGFDTITFDVFLTDDAAIVTTAVYAKLYLDGILEDTQIISVGDNTITFNTLYSNTTYEIIIDTTYDADDGEDPHIDYMLATFESDTDAKYAPVLTIDNIVLEQTSITFDVSGYDTYTVIDGLITAYIYKDGIEVDSVPVTLALGTYTFNGLLTNQEYEIIVKASYDLDDDVTIEVDAELDNIVLSTLPKVLPFISLTNENVDEATVTFDFDYNDIDLVMDLDANLTANLYDGVTLIASTPVLDSSIAFDISSILSGFEFTIEITGDYNLEDETGAVTDQIIWSKTYQTSLNSAPSVVAFDLNKVGFISASISVDDDDLTYVSGLKAELYENGLLLETIPLIIGDNNITFAHMATKLDVYEIRVVENYDLRDGEGVVIDASIYEIIFVNLNNQIPLATLSNIVATKNTVTFDVFAWDPDSVLEAGTLQAVLYKDGSPIGSPIVLSIGANSETFTTLASDSDYEIKIIVSYDLDNGSGVLSSIIDNDVFVTIAKVMPSVTVTNLIADFHEITFDVDLTDTDSVIEGAATAKIYDGVTLIDTFILSDGVNNVSFTPLVANKLYTVEITTSYNLDDGDGQVDDYLFTTFNITTDQKFVPTVAVSNVVTDYVSITFDTNLLDTYTVLEGTVTASLELDGVEVDSLTVALGENTYSFNVLYSGQAYDIIITGTYDLDDDAGQVVDAVLSNFTASTVAYSLPFISSANVDTTENTITFDVDYVNADGVIDEDTLTAELWYDGSMFATGDVLNNSVSFHAYDLLANNEYTVIIKADYDLNVESGAVTLGEVFNEVFTTSENFLPDFTLIDLVVAQQTVTVDYDLLDSSGVLVNLDEVADAVIEFVLYDGVTELDRQTATLGLTQQIIFDAILDYNAMYEVRIETDYNLRDGTGNFTDTSIYELVIASHIKKAPEATAVISGGVIGTNDYTFDVATTMFDVDSALVTDSLIAIIYDSTGAYVDQSAALIMGNNVAVQFTGLDADSDYTIEIVYTYNLENGDGDIVIVPILDSVAFTTNP